VALTCLTLVFGVTALRCGAVEMTVDGDFADIESGACGGGEPEVIISFDRSGSMRDPFGTGTRYTIARDVLTKLVQEFQNKIRFGYEQFPSQSLRCGTQTGPGNVIIIGGCCGEPVSIPPAINNATAVASALARAAPNGGTPTHTAMREVRTFYRNNPSNGRARFVLLSTDGEPNFCNATGGDTKAVTDTVAEIRGMSGEGVKTIVLGLSEVGFGTDALDRMAIAGGAARAGGKPAYYPAKNPAELEQALRSILTGVSQTCNPDAGTPGTDGGTRDGGTDAGEVWN
jgi:hypothetical protein